MKTLISLVIISILGITSVYGQDVTNVEAKSSDISLNLDLEAVASVFSESADLEDFEKRLNDPESHISNLDLNEDGYVDYLRVVENVIENAHVITIQAVIGKDLYQDVATIDVEKDNQETTHVQVIGNTYIYGPGYILQPVFMRAPMIYQRFWDPQYVIWYSPYYWDFYPIYFSYWSPFSTVVYLNYIPTRIYAQNTYRFVPMRRSHEGEVLQRKLSRTDLEEQKPQQAFILRNQGVSNKQELIMGRENSIRPDVRPEKVVKPAQDRTDPKGEKQDVRPSKPNNSMETKPSVPSPERPKVQEQKPSPSTTPSKKDIRKERKK